MLCPKAYQYLLGDLLNVKLSILDNVPFRQEPCLQFLTRTMSAIQAKSIIGIIFSLF